MPAAVTSAPYRHAPASRASAAPAPSLRERLDRIERGIAVMKAGDEALAKGDAAGASRHLADPAAYEAYHARLRGECYQAPVAVTKAEPDHRTTIRKLMADGDMDALGRLMHADPAAHEQYSAMTRAGELAEAAVEGKLKRSMADVGARGPASVAKKLEPADVPEAEVQGKRHLKPTLRGG